MGVASRRKSGTNVIFPVVVAAAGWVVPGLGHLLLRKWSKAAAFFLCVAGLAGIGIALRGHVFSSNTGDLFDLLGFLADLGTGGFYFLSRMLEVGGPDVSRAAGDYGTRFFATAGVLNLLSVLDSHQIARAVPTISEERRV